MSTSGGDLTILEAVLLGVVQGLTEWLPISSSGHLVLTQEFVGIEAPLFFDLLIHLGTLVVVVAFFRRPIADILRALAAWPRDARAPGASWGGALWGHSDRRLALLVVAGSVPTAAIGFGLRGFFEAQFQSVLSVGIALLAMGTFLWTLRFAPEPGSRGPGRLGWRDALVVGIAQGAAIMPGVSRSGSTIGAALWLGVDRETAVRYSFLLSIPTIAGATLFQATDAALAEAMAAPAPYLAGLAAAMVVGYATLFALVLIVRRRGLHWFAPYCWLVGGAAVAPSLWV